MLCYSIVDYSPQDHTLTASPASPTPALDDAGVPSMPLKAQPSPDQKHLHWSYIYIYIYI